MEEVFDQFNIVIDKGVQGYEKIYEDKNNESGFDAKIYAQTVSSTKDSKV